MQITVLWNVEVGMMSICASVGDPRFCVMQSGFIYKRCYFIFMTNPKCFPICLRHFFGSSWRPEIAHSFILVSRKDKNRKRSDKGGPFMKVINTKVEKTENILPQYLGTFFSRMSLQISISLGLKRLFFLAVQKKSSLQSISDWWLFWGKRERG